METINTSSTLSITRTNFFRGKETILLVNPSLSKPESESTENKQKQEEKKEGKLSVKTLCDIVGQADNHWKQLQKSATKMELTCHQLDDYFTDAVIDADEE